MRYGSLIGFLIIQNPIMMRGSGISYIFDLSAFTKKQLIELGFCLSSSLLDATAIYATANKRWKQQDQSTRDTRFKVENLTNAKGKNHGRQPANLHYIGVSVYNTNGGLQEE